MAITKTYDLLNINGVKGWIRDSWARRAIAALQQRVAGIVVPTKTSELTNDSGYITSADVPPGSTASSTTPLMDGTAAVGTENAFARGDHRHPSDTNKADKATTLAGYGITDAYTKTQVDGMIPTKTSDLTNDSGFITSAPVTSVNGQTGAVTINVPTKTSDLTNDSGYITSVPVTSVNTKTGAVSLTASDVGALPSSTQIPSATSDLTNDSGFITAGDVPSASTADPAMDGTATPGSSAAWSRGDHVHPTDTSRQAALSAAQLEAVNSGVTAAKVQAWDGITVPTQTSDLTNDSGFITAADVPDASTATPAMDGTGAAGSSDDYARADHVHPADTSKQDALSAAQMDAVNSGITAAKVAGYDGIVTMFGLPITITSGSDLNDYMTPGHYSANTGAIAGSLTNCPTSVNFSLFVIYRTNTPLVSQIIIASTNAIYARYKTSTSWSSWYRFAGTAV